MSGQASKNDTQLIKELSGLHHKIFLGSGKYEEFNYYHMSMRDQVY